MSSRVPRCEVCNEPMQPVETLEATRGSEKRKVTVYTCYKHKTFAKTEEKV